MAVLLTLIIVAGVVVVVALLLIALPSTGNVQADVATSPAEFLDVAAETFVAMGWNVGYRGGDSLVLRREYGPDLVLGCVLTAFILPLGLAYLLATRNRASIVFEPSSCVVSPIAATVQLPVTALLVATPEKVAAAGTLAE